MEKDFQKNSGYEVLTPDGFKPFAGVSLMGVKPVWRVETKSGIYLECTHDHKIYINGDRRTPVSDLNIGDEILTMDGFDSIVKIFDTGKVEEVYDLIEVEDGHRYYTNRILSSNCQFVSFEELLINPVKLLQLEGMTPIQKTGQVRWYEHIKPECTYVVTLDPSMGTGGDNAAIEVWNVNTLTQVGEWQHNKTPVEGQMRVLRQILQEIQAQGDPEIYWSVESNTLGEACLYIIRDTGEEFFPGTFLSEPNRQVSAKERRKGFLTTNKTKIEACAKLKQLIESDKLQIRSHNLVSELKTYIAKGNTFEAREGDSDDLVSSTLLFIRAAQYIATYDDAAHASMNGDISPDGSKDSDNYIAPMPVAFC